MAKQRALMTTFEETLIKPAAIPRVRCFEPTVPDNSLIWGINFSRRCDLTRIEVGLCLLGLMERQPELFREHRAYCL